jgi:hypothetical protein
MHNDRKPGIRIIAERVSVTTIRFRSKPIYCEKCHRPLGEGQIDLATVETDQRDVIDAASLANATDNGKENK